MESEETAHGQRAMASHERYQHVQKRAGGERTD